MQGHSPKGGGEALTPASPYGADWAFCWLRLPDFLYRALYHGPVREYPPVDPEHQCQQCHRRKYTRGLCRIHAGLQAEPRQSALRVEGGVARLKRLWLEVHGLRGVAAALMSVLTATAGCTGASPLL